MSRSITTVRTIHRANAVAPALAFAALVVLSFVPAIGGPRTDRSAADQRVREVGARLEGVPYRLGEWVGSDEPLPAAALEILHATAVLSRTYTSLRTGERVRLAIVYSGDARDMLGHHPPNCYPSSGWSAAPIPSDPMSKLLEIGIGPRVVSANLFRFSKLEASGFERQITVVGFFALPQVGLTPDESSVRIQSGSRTRSSLGVGQVQILLDGHPRHDRVVALAESVLNALPEATFGMLLGDPADTRPFDQASGAYPSRGRAEKPRGDEQSRVGPQSSEEAGGAR